MTHRIIRQTGQMFVRHAHTDRKPRSKDLPNLKASTDPSGGPVTTKNLVHLKHGDKTYKFSPIYLRDLCSCPRCVDVSTRQKLFSTVDIPSTIRAKDVTQTHGTLDIRWEDDIPGAQYGADHFTRLYTRKLRAAAHGNSPQPRLPERVTWDDETFVNHHTDISYEDYMQNDETLYLALRRLHSYGLLFLTNVPESAESVSAIVQRIGPLKNTFYGQTWDVRSVPEAQNVAYTSQDLGFHMDLLYMRQPPHLQALHCVRSSANGGASLFVDSYRSVKEIFYQHEEAFDTLARYLQTFHYDHAAHYYKHTKKTFVMRNPRVGRRHVASFADMRKHYKERSEELPLFDFVEAVSWAPPFQGPFEGSDLINGLGKWQAAAKTFNTLIHRPEGIHERMMKPGECVIFDNRRVLHARTAFEVADAGKERWLRGAYLDADPYFSRLHTLARRFGLGSRTTTEAHEHAGSRSETQTATATVE